jgi:hypothetical protein
MLDWPAITITCSGFFDAAQSKEVRAMVNIVESLRQI